MIYVSVQLIYYDDKLYHYVKFGKVRGRVGRKVLTKSTYVKRSTN